MLLLFANSEYLVNVLISSKKTEICYAFKAFCSNKYLTVKELILINDYLKSKNCCCPVIFATLPPQ